MNSRLNDEVFHECMNPRYVERDEPRQYECVILDRNDYVDTIYSYAYTLKEVVEMLNKMQNVTHTIDIWEVK